jgi:hypothetical protein
MEPGMMTMPLIPVEADLVAGVFVGPGVLEMIL